MTRPFPSGSHPDVVEEHLEEAAFLYDQRRHLAATGRATWGRLVPIEARFEAHLVGLAVAGPDARVLVQAALDDGVPGSAHVAVRLLCRSDDADAALGLAVGLDGAHARDGIDALVHGAPAHWTGRLVAELETDDPRRVRVAAAVLGAGRRPAGAALVRALARADDLDAKAALVEALGALRYPPARSTLSRWPLDALDVAVARAVERAFLRFGDPRARDLAGARVQESPRAALVLALAGAERHGPLLADAVQAGAPGALVALGVLGDPAHVPLLLESLAVPGTAAGAAVGLRILTGAPLTEEALVLDDASDPGLGGDLVVRPSRAVDLWRAWWDENGGAFERGVRYRAGLPFSPGTAVAAPVGGLADDLLPAPLRNAFADELAGRYGLDAPYDAAAFVTHQKEALSALADDAERGRFRSGEWAASRRASGNG